MKRKIVRSCQPCTACCDGWIRISVLGHEAYPGHRCPHSTGSGCDDYANRPHDPCVEFQCGWIAESSPLPDWMKPNEARVLVVFEKLHWQGYPVDLALPVGRRVPPRALKWLQAFSQGCGRPFLYSEQVVDAGRLTGEQNLFGFGPPDFQAWLSHRTRMGEKLW